MASHRWTAGAVFLLAFSANAQDSGNGYLFHAPDLTLGFRVGFSRPNAGSDVFTEVFDRLTVDRRDFDSLSFSGELGFRVTSRFDVVVSGGASGKSVKSEYRNFVDNDRLPIEQTTSLRRIPIVGTAKFYLTPRGHSVGQYSWIPARFVPYVGAGAGVMWYRFKQAGDFIDFETFDVFPSTLTSSSWTPVYRGVAGVEWSVTPRIAISGEGSYSYAKAELSHQFEGFDKIELSGWDATLGCIFRF